jgi:hypothetical protein
MRRGLLRRLKCDKPLLHHQLSAQVSPIRSERIHLPTTIGPEYFRDVWEQLGETYGVMVYQEDVIKMFYITQDFRCRRRYFAWCGRLGSFTKSEEPIILLAV